MKSLLVADPIEVGNRLDKLGWARDELLEVVSAMVGARRGCTENNTPAGPGFRSWDEGTRRLREIALLKGLHKSDDHQISCAVDMGRGLRMAVMNTDDGTGIEKIGPQPTRRKGAGTTAVVSAAQASLLDLLDQSENVVPLSRSGKQPGIFVWWYLCVFCSGDDIRAELVSPKAYKHGRFDGYYERLLLLSPENSGGGVFEESDAEADEFDIPVSRKK